MSEALRVQRALAETEGVRKRGKAAETRRMEAALRESEIRYRSLFETVREGILIVDGQTGQITAANPFLLDLLGCRPEALQGKALWESGVFRDVEKARFVFAEGRENRPVRYGELELETREGRPIHVEFVSHVYPVAQTRVIQCSLRDISGRREAERRQSLAAEILATINDAASLADTIAAILKAIKRETGFAAVGIRLRSGDDFPYFVQNGFSNDFLLTEERLTVRAQGGGVCRDGSGNLSLECTCGLVISGQTDPTNPLFTPGGSFWINDALPLLDLPADRDPRIRPRNRCIREGFRSIALIPIRVKREIVGLLQLNDRRRDRFTLDLVTFFEGLGASLGIALTRKRAEEAIRERTAQLEAANRELDSFSYSVSHDLRAPLRAIDGYARIILRQQGERFDENTRRQFEVIRRSTATMGQLIDDLLAFSRMGKEALSCASLDVGALARDAWEGLRATQPDRPLELKIEPLPAGMGDRSLIKQVFVNILSNAIKFTRIREVGRIEVGGCEGEGETVFYVRDNGVGFDMQYHDRLFGVFQRGHSADEYEGTGVGLAIVQRIINRHGGRVWAESEPGRGATFYFSLPARRP